MRKQTILIICTSVLAVNLIGVSLMMAVFGVHRIPSVRKKLSEYYGGNWKLTKLIGRSFFAFDFVNGVDAEDSYQFVFRNTDGKYILAWSDIKDKDVHYTDDAESLRGYGIV